MVFTLPSDPPDRAHDQVWLREATGAFRFLAAGHLATFNPDRTGVTIARHVAEGRDPDSKDPAHDEVTVHRLADGHVFELSPHSDGIRDLQIRPALGFTVEPARYLAERYAEAVSDGVKELRQALEVIAADGSSPVVIYCASCERSSSPRDLDGEPRRSDHQTNRRSDSMPAQLHLRPVTESDLDAFDAAFQSEAGASTYQWFGFTPTHALRDALRTRGLLAGPDNMLAVVADGALAGRVEWLERRWGRRDTSLCWEIAAGLLPDFRGRGIGTEAQRQLVHYLFTHTRVERIQATTDPENRAELRCLEKVGFTLEGAVRRAQWRGGRWHDQLLLSLLRNEYEDGGADPT